MKLLLSTTHFDLIKSHRDFIVRRIDGEYKQHSHFSKRVDAEAFMKLIEKNIMPHSTYWKIAARRLLTEEEFENLNFKPRKPMYYNSNKGVRRK